MIFALGYLSTLVNTIYSTPHAAIAVAVFSGSLISGGGGFRAVPTEQNLQTPPQ
jgi:hypothetical protein